VRPVVCFGEALIDFLNTGQQMDGRLSLSTFTQYPGGAPANAAVAVARLGGNAAFAGQVGDDQFGHFLIDALELYGVDTSLVAIHPEAPTALAFVFLDREGERSFSFRRRRTADIAITREQIDPGWFQGTPILHFCSNTLTDEHIADVTAHVVERAREHDSAVSFDVNLRHSLWPAGKVEAEVVNTFVRTSDIVKFSREELDYLSRGNHEGYLSSCFRSGLKAALVTAGPDDIEIRTPAEKLSVTPPEVETVDTTGGGDAFIGAVLYGISLQDDAGACLADIERLQKLVSSAAYCGALAVTRRGAFPSFPTFDEIADRWSIRP
jgi:fructokinase